MSQYITKNKAKRAQKPKVKSKINKHKSEIDTNVALMQLILANIPGHVFWKDETGTYLGCNNNFARTVGLTYSTELIGKRNVDILPREMALKIDQQDNAILATGKELEIEEEGFDAKKQIAIYLTKKIPMYDSHHHPIGIIGTSFNITERKTMEAELKIAKEKAEASDRAKTQFLAMMNHELNTPLSSIIGMVDLIKRGDISVEEEKNLVNTIEDCTRHLLGLVNDVLDFSRLEINKNILSTHSVDLNDLTNEAYKLLHLAAEKKGLELKVKFLHKAEKPILTNHRALLQVLINLISNAIKFTKKGHVIIQVDIVEKQSRYEEQSRYILEIAVIDTGSGIPADKLDLIFEPFKQVEDSYTRQSSQHGTGLGLAIVRKLLLQLGMTIKVESTLGSGSTFTMKGEFQTTDTKAKKIRPAPKNSIPDDITIEQPFRVLLVEDDTIIQFIHKKMLEEYKCEIDIASNGQAAIQMLAQHDIAFVDLTLPDISGFEVIKALREKSNIPIVALTAHTGDMERRECLKLGANKFESKPISRERLRELLVRYVLKR